MTPSRRLADLLAYLEADLSAKSRASDAGARVLAEWANRERQKLELEPTEHPDGGTLPLFDIAG